MHPRRHGQWFRTWETYAGQRSLDLQTGGDPGLEGTRFHHCPETARQLDPDDLGKESGAEEHPLERRTQVTQTQSARSASSSTPGSVSRLETHSSGQGRASRVRQDLGHAPWSVGIRKPRQPRTEPDGKPVTRSSLSPRASVQGQASGILGRRAQRHATHRARGHRLRPARQNRKPGRSRLQAHSRLRPDTWRQVLARGPRDLV